MYPEPYLDYLVQFHVERDYFECHEILEEYWKSAPAEKRQPVWVGLIQIAVGLYHHRRGNLNGAGKMLTSAHALVKEHHEEIERLGLDSTALQRLLAERLDEIQKGMPYRSLTLPMQAAELISAYKAACARQNQPEHRDSDMSDPFLLNKHTLRDRSDVLAERERQLQLRQGKQINPAD
ncbi:DUF309 domain-containing protein [Brevibacillus parabrevis]|uniref:DUF309 domain-containing protein n=1 Tax=Brevibacillus parabrevis TaxID=54914 RepID=UPI001135F091|nr:DUF309 domain-containing protein [Brevibacillus parabrevis]MED1721886.1 DUF309 domain-containing protein [Brevibacillus parabrevis]TGV17778.1 DUF309 domain-containing protein [Mesorhizobium sp. M00.F.Ca.ET.186.01.1.1]